MASENDGVDTKATGSRKKNSHLADESLSAQMKRTKAQVTGTFRKLSTTFSGAGGKLTNAFNGVKNKVSSKK